MSTKYYIVGKEDCKCCGRGYGNKLLGLSSAGHSFLFKTYPDEGLRGLADWMEFILRGNHSIIDEYNKEVSFKEFMEVVFCRVVNSGIYSPDFSSDLSD